MNYLTRWKQAFQKVYDNIPEEVIAQARPGTKVRSGENIKILAIDGHLEVTPYGKITFHGSMEDSILETDMRYHYLLRGLFIGNYPLTTIVEIAEGLQGGSKLAAECKEGFLKCLESVIRNYWNFSNSPDFA